ncbi:MAG: MBL fold metallo-hydrolase [Alphaproteobacteria bacterium]|nr:MBL fold metallo-hydrolase [Alphaproteobacteria bacterium]HPF47098.1 MBL fold metallo-hydrolase [Emcibacteraceae bacterium]HRW30235.1 MBL fold metallo-hydrolase [Emcibacteraceae bacterium]
MRIIIYLLVLVFPATIWAQGRFDDVEITATKISDGLYMLQGSGGNMGISIGEDGVFLIDDQYAPLTDKILAAIKKLSDKEIHFVFNTHYHDDHTGGNENLGKMNIDIAAHDKVYERLHSQNVPKEALPIISFNDEMTFHMNGLTIRTRFYPNAHTESDSVIYFEGRNVIHTGDLFEQSGYPYIDIEAGGSFIGMINAVDNVLKSIDDQTIIIPGHGSLSNKAELENYNMVLKKIYDELTPLADKGLSIEDVIKLPLLNEYKDSWGKGDIRGETFLKFAYNSILKERK